MSNKILHVIDENGNHVTIPFIKLNEAVHNNGNYKYKLDVEWYHNNGYSTFDEFNEKLKEIKKQYDNSK